MYPTVYEPYALEGERYAAGGTVHFAIRTTIDASRLGESVRRAVASVDPAVPVTEFHTQSGLIDRLLRTERLLGILSGAFGAVALTLSAIGLGGLLVYGVARRTNEIGVRIALGAAAGDIIRMVVRDSIWMVGIGVVIGLPCAYAIGRYSRPLCSESSLWTRGQPHSHWLCCWPSRSSPPGFPLGVRPESIRSSRCAANSVVIRDRGSKSRGLKPATEPLVRASRLSGSRTTDPGSRHSSSSY